VHDQLSRFLDFRIKSITNYELLSTTVVKILEIARTILRQPDILFLRESAIDISGLNDKFFLDALFALMPKTTIVYICEDFDFVHVFDHIYWLGNNKILLNDTPKNILADPESLLSKSFKSFSKKSYRFALGSLEIPFTKRTPMEVFAQCTSTGSAERKPRLEAVLQKFFMAYDLDNSGTLDRDEMWAVFGDVCETLDCQGVCTEGNFREMMDRFDLDGNGVFDFGEFYDMIGPVLEEEI
jgi:Ca2+-binding EF-hand superfamily protein